MSEGRRGPGGKERIAPALWLVCILAGAALPAAVFGQARGGGGMGFSPGFAGGARLAPAPGSFAGHGHGESPVHGGVGGIRPQRGIRGGFRHHHHNADGFGSVFLGSPFWYDDGWYGYSSAPAPEEEKAAEDGPGPVVEPALPPAQPLIIERQGDRFVRLSDEEVNAAAPAGNTSFPSHANSRKSAGTQSSSGTEEEVPAVLVFRDGHQQDVASYSIIGGTLYESASYYSSGSWTRKIQLADLDIPATIKMNHERGVNFLLPGGPNQVVTRP